MQGLIARVVPAAMAALMLPGLAACQFVSAYDDVFDQEVATTQIDVTTLMSKAAAAPTLPLASFGSDYTKVQSDFQALSLRVTLSAHNEDTAKSVADIEHSFHTFQAQHDDPAQPHTAEGVRRALSIMNDQYVMLMRQELSKKSVQK